MTRRSMYFSDDEDEGFSGDEAYEECEVCHQEFRNSCPISSADCPYDDLAGEDDEDDDPDFEDVENLGELIGDDEEVEKIIEDDAEIPLEDLVDEDGEEKEEDEGPSKTIEEIEAEQEEEARRKKKAAKASPKRKK